MVADLCLKQLSVFCAHNIIMLDTALQVYRWPTPVRACCTAFSHARLATPELAGRPTALLCLALLPGRCCTGDGAALAPLLSEGTRWGARLTH